MDPSLLRAVLLAALTTGLATAVLLVFKVVHRDVLRWRGVRRAHYVAALGEILSRGTVPERLPPAWREDPVFWDSLADYHLILSGSGTETLHSLSDQLGIGDHLVSRASRKFPVVSRLRAISSLAVLAQEAEVPALRRFLSDKNAHVRLQAARGLGRLRDVASVDRVLARMARAEPWEAARLADSLVAMGPAVVAPITRWVDVAMASDGPSETIALCARVLGIVGSTEAEPVLLALLRSPNPDLRLAAASALEHTATELSTEPLTRALSDGDGRVRARAVLSLASLAMPGSLEQLEPLLGDAVWWVRQNAAAAIASSAGGTSVLLRNLESKDRFAADAALEQLTLLGVNRGPHTSETDVSNPGFQTSETDVPGPEFGLKPVASTGV